MYPSLTHRIAGTAHAETCAWPRLLAVHGTLIPPYPGPSVVPFAVVPAPPRLDPAADVVAHARAVALAYKGAAEKKCGARVWAIDARKDVRAGKHYLVFAECAQALVEKQIAPAAWCAFSVDVWQRYNAGAARVPPVGWVCSGTRVDERADWFAAEAVRYQGGQLWLSALHRDLLRDYACMRRDLLGLREPGTEAVARVVARHFRPGAYDARVERARTDALRAQTMLNDAVARGEFLW